MIMKEMLERMINVESDCCVTVVLNTHRTKPNIQKDVITLKNLISEAEQRLFSGFDKRVAQSVIEKLKLLAGTIDHGNNFESLILFVNQDIAEYIKLPVEVDDRVVIGRTFATRDLIRAMHMQEEYYVLLLSRDKARLIEAMNDQEVQEYGDPFPIENLNLYPATDKEQSKSKQVDLLKEEFFNRVDKAVWSVVNQKPRSIIICTEERNFHHYMKITDYKERILGHLNKNLMLEKASNIVLEAWPIILGHVEEKHRKRIEELHQAVNNGRCLTDTGEIWRAVNEGRGQVIFIKQGYFQPAKVASNLVEVVEGSDSGHEEFVDDIIEKIVEVNYKNGGDAVFLPEDDLKEFQGLALVTRF